MSYLVDPNVLFWASTAVLISILVYVRFICDVPDTDEYFLYNQASVGKIRRPKETAIHRSLVAGHGRSLMMGLSISDESGKTRNGYLHDIWKLAEKASIAVVDSDVEGQSLTTLPREEFEKLVHLMGRKLAEYSANSIKKNVAVLLPPCLEATVIQFACCLFGLSAVYISLNDMSEESLQEALQLSNATVIIGPGIALSKVDYTKLNHLVSVISVHSSFDKTLPKVSVESWSSIAKNVNGEQIIDQTLPDIVTSETYEPAKFIYVDLKTSEMKISCFTTANIVAAVAAQIKILPRSKVWTEKDTILCLTSQLTSAHLIQQLGAFVVGASVVFPSTSYASSSPNDIVGYVKPTIILTDDYTTKSLALYTENLTVVGNIRIRLGLNSLSHGNLPKAIIPEFKSVRLIYSDGTWDSHDLSTSDSNLVRVLAGAALVHSLSAPAECGPICQTGFYDYRAEDDSRYQNFGPVLPCLEGLIKDYGLLKAEKREGELWVRGPAVSSGVEWSSTEMIGKFGVDGCFKLLVENAE